MIFAHAHDAIFKRIKWQTRRLFKPGDLLEGNRVIGIPKNGKEFTRWQVGSTYAIQEGRGTNSIGRIQITGIRLDKDIRGISQTDVQAEGFETRAEFVALWESMYGKQYQAWVLEFELVEDAVLRPHQET